MRERRLGKVKVICLFVVEQGQMQLSVTPGPIIWATHLIPAQDCGSKAVSSVGSRSPDTFFLPKCVPALFCGWLSSDSWAMVIPGVWEDEAGV